MIPRPDLKLPEDIQVSAVAAILVTQDGRYLMQHRDDLPGVRMRGHWGLFGGEIEAGETPEIALGREVDEELGLPIRLTHTPTRYRSCHCCPVN